MLRAFLTISVLIVVMIFVNRWICGRFTDWLLDWVAIYRKVIPVNPEGYGRMNTSKEERDEWLKWYDYQPYAESVEPKCLSCKGDLLTNEGYDPPVFCEDCAQDMAETIVPCLIKDVELLEGFVRVVEEFMSVHDFAGEKVILKPIRDAIKELRTSPTDLPVPPPGL